MIGERNWLAGKIHFTLNINDYIALCTHRPPLLLLHTPKTKPERCHENTHQHPLVLYHFGDLCIRRKQKKKKKKLFQIIIFPRHWEFKDLYEKK